MNFWKFFHSFVYCSSVWTAISPANWVFWISLRILNTFEHCRISHTDLINFRMGHHNFIPFAGQYNMPMSTLPSQPFGPQANRLENSQNSKIYFFQAIPPMFQNATATATANSNMMFQQFAQFQHRQFQMPFVQPQPIRPVPMPTFPGFQYQNRKFFFFNYYFEILIYFDLAMLMGMQQPPPDPRQIQLPLSQRAPGPVSRRSHSQDQPSCSREHSQSVILGYERRMGRPQKTFRQKYEQYLPNSQNSRK